MEGILSYFVDLRIEPRDWYTSYKLSIVKPCPQPLTEGLILGSYSISQRCSKPNCMICNRKSYDPICI